jgi:hypothetical protein
MWVDGRVGAWVYSDVSFSFFEIDRDWVRKEGDGGIDNGGRGVCMGRYSDWDLVGCC